MGEAGLHAVIGRQGALKQTMELVERHLVTPVHG
jgi:hypothetical protein